MAGTLGMRPLIASWNCFDMGEHPTIKICPHSLNLHQSPRNKLLFFFLTFSATTEFGNLIKYLLDIWIWFFVNFSFMFFPYFFTGIFIIFMEHFQDLCNINVNITVVQLSDNGVKIYLLHWLCLWHLLSYNVVFIFFLIKSCCII